MAAESADSRALKLVVFGGTGGTGKEVVTQALEQGYLVTAVVRTPGKVEKRHPNLELVKGDACDVESFIAALKGKGCRNFLFRSCCKYF
ncbi:flavin reductase (NADPH)-like [Oculina patagonica]